MTGLVAATVAAATVTTLVPNAQPEEALYAEEPTEELAPIRSQVFVAAIDVQVAGESLTLRAPAGRRALPSRSRVGGRTALPPSLSTDAEDAIDSAERAEPLAQPETSAQAEQLNAAEHDAASIEAALEPDALAVPGDYADAEPGDGALADDSLVDGAPATLDPDSSPLAGTEAESATGDAAELAPAAEATDLTDQELAALAALADAGAVVNTEAISTPVPNSVILDRADVVTGLIEQALNPELEIDLDEFQQAIDDLNAVTENAEIAPVFVEPAPMTAADYLQAMIFEAQADRHRLQQSYAHSVSSFQNGRIPASAMRSLSWAPSHRMRADAAAQFERLNVAFRAHFGVNLSITDSYRSFENQVRVRAARPHLAAVPGTSNHGWGIAVDLGGGVQRFGTAQHQWLRRNAPFFGWVLPAWAQERGSKPEPWHWEFHPSQMVIVDGGAANAADDHASDLLNSVGD